MISLITLTYNNYEQLVETLGSVPEDNSFESVVVNGGQCLNTINYLKNHKGIVINEKDDGISDAFNKGILASHGEYIMVLNSGDVLLKKDYLLKAEKILEEDSSLSFVHSNILFEERFAGSLVMHPKMKNIGRGMPYFHQTMIIRKLVFDRVKLYKKNFRISMDYDLVVRMEKLKMKGFYLNEDPVVKMDGKGVSNTRELKTLLEAVDSLCENKYLNFPIIFNLSLRIFRFILRKLTVTLGAKGLYIELMRFKYKKSTLDSASLVKNLIFRNLTKA